MDVNEANEGLESLHIEGDFRSNSKSQKATGGEEDCTVLFGGIYNSLLSEHLF